MTEPKTCATCRSPIPSDAPDGGCPRCLLGAALGDDTAPAPHPTLRIEDVETKLPAFEILGVLGQGGMGVVYKARQKALDRIVALKVLPPAIAASPGFAERFAREAKAMARLQHPNIVAVHDFGESGGLFWLSMEYIDGLNVREAMRAGRVTPKDALTIVPPICDALQYAHDRGVVHRDVKPENVMIGADGRVKVADFGLAKIAGSVPGEASLTGAQQVMGTVHYMAPEQWQRPKEVDHRADIYSLGVMFYEMLTGELPIGRFEPPSHRASIDVRVDEVVMRSLERERERRWQNASDVRTQVDGIAAGPAAPPTPIPAVAAPAVASEPEDEGMKEAAKNWPDTFPNAAITFAVAVAFGVAAYFTQSALWWVAGTFGVGAVAQAIQAAANRAKETRPAPAVAPEPHTSRLALFGAKAVFVGLATGAAAIAIFDKPSSREVLQWMELAAGIVLAAGWIASVVAWMRIRTSQGRLRGAWIAGAAVVVPVVALFAMQVGKLAVERQRAGEILREVRDQVRKNETTTNARGEDERSAGVTFSFPEGVTGSAGDEDAVVGAYRSLQTAQSTGKVSFQEQYASADWLRLQADLAAELPDADRSGRLGLPALGSAGLGGPLSAFRVKRVSFLGRPASHSTSARVEASNGARTIRFTMLRDGGDDTAPVWKFAASPVEIE